MRAAIATFLRLALATLLMFGALGSALAGSYAVAPVIVGLGPASTVAEVSVENRGDGELRIEARMFAWTQDAGGDRLDPTREVIAFPPVFVLAPGESQTVRVAWRGLPAAEERAYRLSFDELPGAIAAGQVAVMVRQILPVFYRPTGVAPARIAATIDESRVSVRITNSGASHQRALALRWYNRAGTMLAEQAEPFYILAGGQRALALPPWPADRTDARVLKLQTPTGEIALVAD